MNHHESGKVSTEWVDPSSVAVEALHKLDRTVQAANPLTIMPLSGIDDFRTMIEKAHQSGGDTVGLRDGDEFVGYVTFSISRAAEAWSAAQQAAFVGPHLAFTNIAVIDSLIVDPDTQGSGHGSRLMRIAEEASVERECDGGVALMTSPFGAKGFYEKIGYKLWLDEPISYRFGTRSNHEIFDLASRAPAATTEAKYADSAKVPIADNEARLILHKTREAIVAGMAGRISVTEHRAAAARANNELHALCAELRQADTEALYRSRVRQFGWESLVLSHCKEFMPEASIASDAFADRIAPRLFASGLLGAPNELAIDLRPVCKKYAYLAATFNLAPETVAQQLLEVWRQLTPDEQAEAEAKHQRVNDAIQQTLG